MARFLYTLAFVYLTFVFYIPVLSEEANTGELPVFTETQNSVGIFNTGNLGQTAVWGDFNGDGWQDLLVSNTDRIRSKRKPRRIRGERPKRVAPPPFSSRKSKQFYLFKNDAGTKFTDYAELSGIPNAIMKTGAWADYDNDGFPDLSVATIRAATPPLLYKNVDGLYFIDVSEKAGLNSDGSTTRHSIWVDYDRDGFIDLFAAGNQYSHLYRNKGDGTFEDVSTLAGFTEPGNAESAVFFDADNDGWPDLFLAIGGLNKFYLNNKDGTFTDSTLFSGLSGAKHWHTSSACVGDYNSDGFLDLYITNIGKARRNALYRNNKDGTFTDVTWITGTADVGDGRTCAWIDFDADGKIDLFTTNHIPTSKLFRNLGEGAFKQVAPEVNLSKPIDVFAATWADYDRDGFLDVYLNGHIGNTLKRNEGNSNNSITLKLVGNGLSSNSSAIGARAQVSTPDGSQIQEVSGGRGGTEQDMLPIYFGLGKFNAADIKILWPSGNECVFKEVSIQQSREFQISELNCDIIAMDKAVK